MEIKCKHIEKKSKSGGQLFGLSDFFSYILYKGKIIKIIKYSIYYAVENSETVDQLVRIINLLTTKEIQKLRTQKPFHGIDAVIEQLYKFKDEIKVFGNRYSKII